MDSVEPGDDPAVQLESLPLRAERARVALLWLNRPDQLNAMNWELVRQLEAALHAAERDPSVRAVLITGRGRAFSSGGDLKGYLTLQKDDAAFRRFLDDFHRTMGSIRYMRKPVVALVNGVTAAGGLELLLACDFAYAAETAQIGDAHVNFAQMGGGGSLALLPRTVGPFRARELFFSGRLISAQQALEWGLVNAVFPTSDLIDAGIAFADQVATKSPRAVATGKLTMNRGFADGLGLEAALDLEKESAATYARDFPDSMEGLRAFAERRKPVFRSEE